MITHIGLLRNIGHFNNVDSGRRMQFRPLTLIYAENGRGKTTLSSVFRSLATDDASPITERKRFGAEGEPHATILTTAEPNGIVFEANAWSTFLPDMVVFDDSFVDNNVYSGLSVSPQHRQGLHDVILGPEAVQLQRALAQEIETNERLNGDLRGLESEIKPYLPQGYTIQSFCSLALQPDVDSRLEDTRRDLEAAKQRENIAKTPAFDSFELPSFALESIQDVLSATLASLDTEALRQNRRTLCLTGASSRKVDSRWNAVHSL